MAADVLHLPSTCKPLDSTPASPNHSNMKREEEEEEKRRGGGRGGRRKEQEEKRRGRRREKGEEEKRRRRGRGRRRGGRGRELNTHLLQIIPLAYYFLCLLLSVFAYAYMQLVTLIYSISLSPLLFLLCPLFLNYNSSHGTNTDSTWLTGVWLLIFNSCVQ